MSGDIVKQIRSFEGLGYFDLSTQADLICVVETSCWSKKRARLLLKPATGAINALPGGSKRTAESICMLGRIPTTGEYKMLRVGIVYPAIVQPCQVITLGSGDGQSWREKSSPPVRVSTRFRFVSVVGGVAYFLSDCFSVNTPDQRA
ncbi:hypothetical protein BAE44_0000775 [Dichanthelium oligosanthes]|uniref:F-box associated beta-propeller type 3 domain-containing protein n=1 Tax=Dichanthelium oligosanthes TaxID=888268 RepID=A0A1E5WLB8_9POAL|nr:hypothetical protein BAE44_0000775 [Dichanthelium oligosanthes]